jgi:WD40 repeat protein
MKGHTDSVRCVVYNPNPLSEKDNSIVSCSNDNTLIIWKLDHEQIKSKMEAE